MIHKPLLSIITVNLNNIEGLKRTVQSVIKQSFKNFEFIVIDGGSKDGSREYLEEHLEHITFWSSEPDKGIYNAMNKGINIANGNYLLFLNSGDNLLNSAVLSRIYVHLYEKDIIYFDINVSGKEKFYTKFCPEILTFHFLSEDTLPHQSTFIKKELFERTGYYDEKLKITSDWKFFILTLCKFNATYKHIAETFSTFYLDGRSSDKINRIIVKQERQQVLQSEFSVLLNDLKLYSETKKTLKNLKKSKKIQLLYKLGLINKF